VDLDRANGGEGGTHLEQVGIKRGAHGPRHDNGPEPGAVGEGELVKGLFATHELRRWTTGR